MLAFTKLLAYLIFFLLLLIPHQVTAQVDTRQVFYTITEQEKAEIESARLALIAKAQAEYDKQVLEAYKQELKNRAEKLRAKQKTGGYNPCLCLSYARWKTGLNVGPIGIAARHPINSQVPVVGSILILHSKPYGHAVAVELVEGDVMTYSECNFDYKCGCRTSTIKLGDKRIVGFWVP